MNSSTDFDVHATSAALDKDMRFHVLGLGPVGQLFAFHLRRSIPVQHDITLMFKTIPLAKRMRNQPLHIEYQGVVSSMDGFETEALDILRVCEIIALFLLKYSLNPYR